MNEFEVDIDVQSVACHVGELSRRVPIDPHHRVRLRQELLRRHQELFTDHSPRAGSSLWSRIARLKGLTLVAPPALAVGLVLASMLSGVQIPGGGPTRTADAQRLTAALVRTVPTVTGWHTTVTRRLKNASETRLITSPLGRNQRVYVLKYRGKLYPYLYIGRKPFGVPHDWQWTFAHLPVAIANHRARVLNVTRQIAGQHVIGVRLDDQARGNRRVRTTAWVGRRSGKILLLERTIFRGGIELERDVTHYQYRSPRP